LYQSIVKKKQYPYMSRRLGQEGKVILLVEIHRNGTLKGAPRILRSSDYDLLNQEAIRMVKAAAPWPSMPSGYSQKSKRFRITIRFTLN
jgi:protein TonB